MAQDRTLTVDPSGFWAAKTPCWEIRECIPEMCEFCPAYLDQPRACWQAESTPCKELLRTSTCFVCEVFLRYGSEQATA